MRVRAQCFTESSWATMTKDFCFCLDLGQLTGEEKDKQAIIEACTKGARAPPLLPDEFVAEMADKSFTNGKDDKPLTERLYREAFAETFGQAKELDYAYLGWGDADAAKLARLIESGVLTQLEELRLWHNAIGDAGAAALAAAIGKGGAPALKAVYLDSNPASGAAEEAVEEAVAKLRR